MKWVSTIFCSPSAALFTAAAVNQQTVQQQILISQMTGKKILSTNFLLSFFGMKESIMTGFLVYQYQHIGHL